MTDTNYIMDLIGYSGGIVLSLCLIPQIHKTIKTKEVENISYIWQLMYMSGLGLHLSYGIYYNLLPIFIPTIIEICLIILLFSLKIIYKKNIKNIISNV